MQIINSPALMHKHLQKLKAKGKSIGFVATMGFLHNGHLTLVKRARKQCDIVVVSIFVNPAQFTPGEDFESYPRDLKRDSALLSDLKVDYLFYPPAKAIYPPGYKTFAEVYDYQDKLCGAFRPGHFRGVCTIVLKFFNIINPDKAYFGTKDAQQLRIIEKMTHDLNLPVKIVPVLTVRESDGLAMSSRNIYLTPQERKAAPLIYKSLKQAKTAIAAGKRNASEIKELIKRTLQESKGIKPQYLSIASYETLEELEHLKGKVLIAIAANLGKARLIDNIILKVDEHKR
jgi:pantoate--beta-alanine ligase